MNFCRIPPVRKRQRMMPPKEGSPIDVPHHRAFVRKRECCVAGKLTEPHRECVYAADGQSDPHHSKTRGAGGGDESCVPLCRYHHNLLDSPNWSQQRLEREARVSFADISAGLWRISPPAQRYRLKHQQQTQP